MSATFVVEQRQPGKKYFPLSVKPNIHAGLVKFHISTRPGMITRLRAIADNITTTLLRG
jgi:hypothetical protein